MIKSKTCYLKHFFKAFSLTVFICTYAISIFSEDYSEWSYSAEIIINTAASGANVSGDVYNFPILIRLDTSNFDFSQAMSNGYDIRFSKSDISQHLVYERERWSLTALDSAAEIWVLCDTVFGNNSSQYIKIYWGKTGVGDSSLASEVFGIGNNFSAAWHLNEEGNATVLDATSANNDGTSSSFTTSSDVSGVIGIAREFDGTDDYLQITNDVIKEVLSTGNKKTTLSFWVKADNTAFTSMLIWEGESSANGWGSADEFHFTFGAKPAGNGMDNYITLYFGDSEDNVDGGNMVHATEAYSDTVNWHYASVTVDNSNGTSETAILYIDGIPVDTSIGAVQADFNDWNTNTRIGRTGTSQRYFDGILDEIRITNDVRDADWIKLSHESQRTGQSVTQLNYSSAAKITNDPQSDTVALNDPVQFTVSATGNPQPTFQWMKNGVAITGEIMDTLSIASVTATDEGVYNAIATNASGSDTSDNAYLLTIPSAPIISGHPQSDTVALNDPVQFTAFATGNPQPTYQWIKDGVIIAGETMTTLSIPSVTDADKGKYNAIATNASGSDTSDNAYLLAYDSVITITSQPQNDTILEGQSAQFSITATGYNCVYQWQKNTFIWFDIAGETSDSLSFTANSGDNGKEYRCIVSSGPVSDTSKTALLYISTVPIITGAYPSDTVIAAGQTLMLVPYADSWPPPQYTWYVKPTQSSDSSVVSSGPLLTLSDIQKTDTMYYFFIADNGYGNARSTTIKVSAADPVVINIDLPNKLPVINKGSLILSPDISGDGTITYQWYENDVLIPDDTGSSFTLASVDSTSHHGNRYLCKISNYYMNMHIKTVSTRVCTLHVTEYYNPFKVKAERISTQNTRQVRIKLWKDTDDSNFPFKDPVFPPSPWADSIWVFYKSNSYATDLSQTPKVLFSTEQIIHAIDTLSDTLTVGPLPQINDSCFWFNYSILWHNPNSSEGTLLKPLIEANKVFMKDTIAPPNHLVVFGEYVMKTDTAVLTINGINSLSPEQDSLITVQLSYYSQFNALTRDTALSVQTLLNGGDQYTLILDSIDYLPLEEAVMYCRWFIIGKNNIQGAPEDTSFTVGWPRPVYNGTLSIDSTHMGNTVVATWDLHTDPIKNIRIWYDTSPIPMVHNIQLADVQAHYVTSLNVTTDTIKGLSNNTTYYFGLQILKDNLWSEITSQSSVQGKTALGDTSQLPNIISIDSSWFHDSTNSIVIQWHIDLNNLPPDKAVEMGYTYTLNEALDTSNKPLTWYPIDIQTQITSIPLYPDITFDTVNTVGFWIRGVDSVLGPGFPNHPTDSSTTIIHTPSFTWQEITFFSDGVDTVYAANNKIMFVPEIYFPKTDTLYSFNPDTLPHGFVNVGGSGFHFGKKALQVPSFTIGLKYDVLPAGVKQSDIGIYQYKNGDFHILHGFDVESEAVWNTISSECFQNPIILLADTLAPKITVTPFNDTTSPENIVITKFKITDNNANTFWQFLYGAGHEEFSNEKNGYISGCVSDSLKIEITNSINNVINPSFGLRAIIVASDGISTDTFNVSRSVRSKMSGFITAPEGEWISMGSPVHLGVPQLDKIFDKSIHDYLPWEYTTQDLRLFRWYNLNTEKKNSWVEYSESIKDEFDFIPGRLIWCKTSETQVFYFGNGVTISLKRPFEIQLKPENWTDITMPFKFDIMLRDILETTGVDESKNLDVYYWQKMDKTFEAVELFIGSIDSVANIRDTIKAQQEFNGYVINNRSKNPVTLRIPPICLPLSQYTNQTERSHKSSCDSWNISIKWKNKEGDIFRGLKCGYKKSWNNTNTYGTLPPSMSKMKVGILNNENTLCSWSIKPKLIRGGLFFEVLFRNNSNTDKNIEYFLDNLDALPMDFSAKILNPETNTYEPIEEEKPLTIHCSPNTSNKRTVAIGTKQFLDMMVSAYLPLRLLKAYPNPFHKRFKISYQVPIGIHEIQFILYNLYGQQLWNHTQKNIPTPGYHVFSFDGKTKGLKNGIVPSGVYILQLKAKNTAGSILYGGEKRITSVK